MPQEKNSNPEQNIFEGAGINTQTAKLLTAYTQSNNNNAEALRELAEVIKESNEKMEKMNNFFYGKDGEDSIFEKKIEKRNNTLLLKLSSLVGIIMAIAGFIFWVIENKAIEEVIQLINKMHGS